VHATHTNVTNQHFSPATLTFDLLDQRSYPH